MKRILVTLLLLVSCVSHAPVDITGLDKGALLQLLWFGNKEEGSCPMYLFLLDRDEAASIAKKGYIDELEGRKIQMDLSGNFLETTDYNSQHGQNTAETIIENFKKCLHNSIDDYKEDVR